MGGQTVGIACVYWHVVGGGTQGFVWVGYGVASGTVYRTVFLSRGPARMVWFLRSTLTWYSVNLTLHP